MEENQNQNPQNQNQTNQSDSLPASDVGDVSASDQSITPNQSGGTDGENEQSQPQAEMENPFLAQINTDEPQKVPAEQSAAPAGQAAQVPVEQVQPSSMQAGQAASVQSSQAQAAIEPQQQPAQAAVSTNSQTASVPAQSTPSQAGATPAAMPPVQVAPAGTPPPANPVAGQTPAPKPKKKISIFAILAGLFFLLLFLSVLLIFVLVVGGADSPLLTLLGIEALSIQTGLLSLTNTIFSIFSIVLFVVLAIGIFRRLLAKKDETEKRKSSLILSVFAGITLFVTMVIWIALYNFIASFDFELNIKAEITLNPSETENLVIPTVIEVGITNAILVAENKGKKVEKILWDLDDNGDFERQGIDDVLSFEVTKSGMNRIRASLQLSDGTFEEFEKLFFIKEGTFNAIPDVGPVPLAVEFDASNITTGNSTNIVEYRWYFDGPDSTPEVTEIPVVTHTFTDVGSYNVQLVTVDNAKVINKYTKVITAKGGESTGEEMKAIISTYPGNEGTAPFSVTLDAVNSYSVYGSLVKFKWSFGKFEEPVLGQKINRIFDIIGENEVTLEITDNQGNTETNTTTINVIKDIQKPVAVIQVKPDGFTGKVPHEVKLDASKSTDLNNDIIEYLWDINGDSVPDKNGEKIDHVFREVGIHVVTLTVIDSEGNSDKKEIEFDIKQRANKALIKVDQSSGPIPFVVSFDASASQVDTDDKIVNYEWDFGDKTSNNFGGAKVQHKYTVPGTYVVTLRIHSEKGIMEENEINIFAKEISLQSCFTSSKTYASVGSKIKFDPYCSQGNIEGWKWDFGDGNISHTRAPVHRFERSGQFTVILEITDKNNNVSRFSQDVTID